jgi:single-strand DNA-binding protein
MSSDAIVTLEGWVGSDPQAYTAGDAALTKFRIGHTPRRYRRSTGEWIDGETQWFTVSTWRQLAVHCMRSVHKGDPVIVHGRLTQRTWQNRSGDDVVSLEIDAISVGHDLSMGIGMFNRTVGNIGREFAPVRPQQEPESANDPRSESGAEPESEPPGWGLPGSTVAPPEPEPRPDEDGGSPGAEKARGRGSRTAA